MTYIVGWVANGAAHLVADSVLIGRQSARTATSFGQTLNNSVGQQLEECAFKISTLGPTTLAAFSGPVTLGNSCIEFLHHHRALFPTIRDLLDAATVSLGQSGESVDVLIADANDRTGPSLTVWNSSTGVVPHASDVVQLGSVHAFHRAAAEHLVRRFCKDCADNKLLLHVVLANLQAFGVHDLMSESGIGGVMVGATVGANGVRFQEDITYILYGPESLIGMVLVRVREGVVVVYSTLTHDGIIMANAENTPDLQAWRDAWMPHYARLVQQPEAAFVALIATAARNIVLVHQTTTEHPRELSFVRVGRNTQVTVSGELARLLGERHSRQPLAETFFFSYWPQPPLGSTARQVAGPRPTNRGD